MRKILIIGCGVLIFLIFHSVWSSMAHTLKSEAGKWSFNFENCTVYDALQQISKKTGIRIFTTIHANHKILNKSYVASEIDDILTDIFRKENYAIIWKYKERKLDSVEIWYKDDMRRANELKVSELHETSKQDIPKQLPFTSAKKDVSHQSSPNNIPQKWQHLDSPPMPPIDLK